MNPLMNPVGSKAEEKLNCINATVITHVVADFVSFATTFYLKKSSLIHSVAPPFQIATASLGCDLVLDADLKACTSKVFTLSTSEQAAYHLLRLFAVEYQGVFFLPSRSSYRLRRSVSSVLWSTGRPGASAYPQREGVQHRKEHAGQSARGSGKSASLFHEQKRSCAKFSFCRSSLILLSVYPFCIFLRDRFLSRRDTPA